MEDHETLKAGAIVSKLADAVQDKINDLLAHGVVTTGVVVGGVFLAGDQLLRVVQLTVGAGTDLVAHSGSRSTKTQRGTCLPAPVSEKKVLKESSPPPTVLSEGIWPSGWMPCSRQ